VEEEIRKRLKQLIVQHGSELSYNPQRLEALLKDYCGEHKREINLLVIAARGGTARELLNTPGTKLEAWDFQRLVKRLSEDTGMSEDFARWAVESWALALGKELPDKQTQTSASAQPSMEQQVVSPRNQNFGKQTLVYAKTPVESTKGSETRWILDVFKLSAVVVLAIGIYSWGTKAWKRSADEPAKSSHNNVVHSSNQTLKATQQEAGILRSKGDGLGKLRSNNEAVYSRSRALEKNRQDASAQRDKALTFSKPSPYEETTEDRVQELRPKNASELREKGFSLSKLGRYEEAIEYYDRALEINQRDASAWAGKGFNLSKLGRHEEAIECYDRALEIKPKYASVWRNKGFSLSRLGRYEEAVEYYDRALEINQRDASAWADKGFNLSKLGRYEEAIECYDKALEINPDLDWVWRRKAYSLTKLGRHDEAKYCYNQAKKINQQGNSN